MFTGLIQAVGEVVKLEGGWLEVAYTAPEDWEPIQKGESIAISGACLTVVTSDPFLGFDLSEETVVRTSLGARQKVNLERALRVGDRLGGHLVQGHVDGVGKLIGVRETEQATVLRFQVPTGRYLIDKGSIALEGVSLTVVDPTENEFDVWVIPHTLAHTNLGSLNVGDPVNVEYDQVAKYLERLTTYGTGA